MRGHSVLTKLRDKFSKDTLKHLSSFFSSIRLPLEFLPVLGPLERYMMPTLDTALLCSSRASSDLGLSPYVSAIVLYHLN